MVVCGAVRYMQTHQAGGFRGQPIQTLRSGQSSEDHRRPEGFWPQHPTQTSTTPPLRDSPLGVPLRGGEAYSTRDQRRGPGKAREREGEGPRSRGRGPCALGVADAWAAVWLFQEKEIKNAAEEAATGPRRLSSGRLPALITPGAGRVPRVTREPVWGILAGPGPRSRPRPAPRKAVARPAPPAPRPVRPLLTLQTAGSGQAEGEDSQRQAVALPPPARQRPHEQAPRAAGPALASRAARRGAAPAVRSRGSRCSSWPPARPLLLRRCLLPVL